MKWNDDWRNELKETDEECYYRLCECRNSKKDLFKMACLLKKYNKDKSNAECLDRMIEWVCDWNNQFIDLMYDEYSQMLHTMSILWKE